jgi:hypothetical protein
MDRRENEKVFVKERRACLIARRVGRVERKLRQEAFAARIARSDLFELHQVRLAGRRVAMDAFEVGLIPSSSYQLDLSRLTDEPP